MSNSELYQHSPLKGRTEELLQQSPILLPRSFFSWQISLFHQYLVTTLPFFFTILLSMINSGSKICSTELLGTWCCTWVILPSFFFSYETWDEFWLLHTSLVCKPLFTLCAALYKIRKRRKKVFEVFVHLQRPACKVAASSRPCLLPQIAFQFCPCQPVSLFYHVPSLDYPSIVAMQYPSQSAHPPTVWSLAILGRLAS